MRFIFLHKKEPCIAAELQGFAEDEASLLRKDHSDYRRLLRKPLASSFASYSPTGSQPERCGLPFCIKKEPCIAAELKGFAGNLLLSHRIAPEVPSPLEGLTAVFGMGTGGSPPLSSPANFVGGSRPMSGGLLRCCPHVSSAYLSTLTSAFGQPPCIPCSLNAHRSGANSFAERPTCDPDN